MASSGDYDFNLSSYKIITGAMRLIGAIQSGEVPPAEEYEDAEDALNSLITHWQASGIHVWSQIDCTLFLQTGQRTYHIGPGTTDHCCLSADWTQTYLVTQAFAGSASLIVADATGIAAGDKIAVVTQNPAAYFWATVAGAPSGVTVPLTASLPATAPSGARVVSYTTDLMRPLKVPSGRRLVFAGNNGTPARIETPMAVYSRLDYGMLPNKDNRGEVTCFFYDPQLGRGVIHVWPSPATPYQAMTFTAQRPLQDFLDQRDTADLPVEWISALRYNLAIEVAAEYDVPAERFQIVKALAAEKLLACQAFDREPESVYFGLQRYPDARNG